MKFTCSLVDQDYDAQNQEKKQVEDEQPIDHTPIDPDKEWIEPKSFKTWVEGLHDRVNKDFKVDIRVGVEDVEGRHRYDRLVHEIAIRRVVDSFDQRLESD